MAAQLGAWTLRAAVLAALIFGGHELIKLVAGWLDLGVMPHTEDMLHRAILIGTGAYVGLMALPFVPGAEIGLTLMTALGGTLAPLVYLATALSLTLAYLVGRLLPPQILCAALKGLGLKRAAAFVDSAARMTEDDLRVHMAGPGTPRVLRGVLTHRYITLALLLNLPGNMVLGGGGGIALMAGLSRLFHPIPYLLTVLIAVLPVPLLFYAGGA